MSVVTHDDMSTITYEYDAGDRLIEVGDSQAGTIRREYDLLDRLTAETTPEGTIGYAYDDTGRRTSMTVSGQPSVAYAYDAADRLTSIMQGTAVVGFTYDNNDRRTSVTLPNGIVVDTTYDASSQVTSLTYTLGSTPLGGLTYTYDLAGNRTAVLGTWARTGLPPALTAATYDAANQVTTWGTAPLTYDLNGNLTGDGTRSYTWDARNQLASLSGPVSASFSYDGVGRRRAKSVAGSTTSFLYDGDNAIQELAGGGVSANISTGFGFDAWLMRSDSNGVRYLLPDALGNVVALADESGGVQTEYSYEPFGRTTTTGASSANPSQFTGRENDGTGLYYYRARYQHPELQRFISEDPLEFLAGDPNLYSYVGNSPTHFTDPTGEFWAPVIGCLLGAGSSAGGDKMAGRKIDWPAAAAGCASGAFGGAGRAAAQGAAAMAKAAGKAAAGAAGRAAASRARKAARDGQKGGRPSKAEKQTPKGAQDQLESISHTRDKHRQQGLPEMVRDITKSEQALDHQLDRIKNLDDVIND